MAYFQGAGYIGSDLVRRETSSRGVVTGFRLACGRPGHGQVWIDVDAWGHRAGVLNAHGRPGRPLLITGRLAQRSWRDRSTGRARSTLFVRALDFDFLDDSYPDYEPIDVPNQVIVPGRVDDAPRVDTERPTELCFAVVSGRAGAKSGRLRVAVQAWGDLCETARGLHVGHRVLVEGRLAYRRQPDGDGGHFINLRTLHTPGHDDGGQPAARSAVASPTVM